jgi:hypothetical protein
VRNLDEEEGPGSAMYFRGASPESWGGATNSGAESSEGWGAVRLQVQEVEDEVEA